MGGHLTAAAASRSPADSATSPRPTAVTGLKQPTVRHQSALIRAMRSVVLPWFLFLLFEPFFKLRGSHRERSPAALREVERILIVRLDRVGDVVLSSPFLRELRWNLPRARITLLVTPATRNLAESCPYVDEVLTHEWAGGKLGPLRASRLLASAFTLSRQWLWPRRFDLTISLKGDVDRYYAQLIVYLSGARRRIAYASSDGERRRANRRFYTDLFCNEDAQHEVERGLDMIPLLGGAVRHRALELWTLPEDELFAERLLTSHAAAGELIVSFGVGAGGAKRKWPIENFIEVGRWLAAEFDARILAIGSPDERMLGEKLAGALGDRVINVVGDTTLRQAGALLRRCSLHVGNDSGPMHIAAAAGIPVVEISCHPLSGSEAHCNSPVRFGPWMVPHTVAQPKTPMGPCTDECRADHAHCILGLSIEEIKEAVSSRLRSTVQISTRVSG